MDVNIKIYTYTFFIIFFGLCCCVVPKKEKTSGTTVLDTMVNEDASEQDSYESMRKEYMAGYNRKEIIDTTVANSIHFRLIHYCLFDTILIPSKYHWGEKPTDFLTHGFGSELVINKGSDILLTKLITKRVFDEILSDDLKPYGVLLYPTFRGFNQSDQSFLIHYSISIPMTDVGKSVLLKINTDGSIEATEE